TVDLDALVELLGDGHRLARPEAELLAGILLQGGGDEGRRRISPTLSARDRAYQPPRALEPSHHLLDGLLAPERGLLAGDLLEGGREVRRLLPAQARMEGPVLHRLERLDLTLAIDDEADGHRLHPAGGEAAPQLVPQKR